MEEISDYLKSPDPIGGVTPNSGKFTTLKTTTSAVVTDSTSVLNIGDGDTRYALKGSVPDLHSPGSIGDTTPSAGVFTTLNRSTSATVSDPTAVPSISDCDSRYAQKGSALDLASPPAIGGTTPNTGTFTDLKRTTSANLTDTTEVLSMADSDNRYASKTLTAPGPIGTGTPAVGVFTDVRRTTASVLTDNTEVLSLGETDIRYAPKVLSVPGPIGGTTPASGSFTDLKKSSAAVLTDVTEVLNLGECDTRYASASSSVNLASPGPIGSTTPSTGVFTDLKRTVAVTSSDLTEIPDLTYTESRYTLKDEPVRVETFSYFLKIF